jgi:hypothetical protein
MGSDEIEADANRDELPGKIVAGIDEAGLGPLLGPLTLGFSVLRLPGSGVHVWDALDDLVAPTTGRKEERIVIADSKKVYARNPRGRQRLETSVLAFLAQRADGAPSNGAELLRTREAKLRPRKADVAVHPWYASLPKTLPLWCDAGRLELRAEALRRSMKRADIQLLDAGVRLVPAGELNRSFRKTSNKSATVWKIVGDILLHLWEEYGERHPHVIIDRQGGRFRYGKPLGKLFPKAKLRVGPETPAQSEYRLELPGAEGKSPRSMRLTFAEKAEDRAFTVALGSCIAKYARELTMEAFNEYFQELQPGLAPTAGYTTDGRRWVAEAREMLDSNHIDPEVLIRQR